ncbi:MAG: hypothetical protein WA086_12995, partial [Ideonella sp.]
MTDTLANLKQQLLQIDALQQSGALPPDAAVSARANLERRLLDLVLAGAADVPVPGPTAPRPSRRLLLALTGFVLVFGAAGYAWRGSSVGWQTAPGAVTAMAGSEATSASAAAASAPHSMGTGQIEGMVASLAERLKAQPEDADGWLMMGRSLAVLG